MCHLWRYICLRTHHWAHSRENGLSSVCQQRIRFFVLNWGLIKPSLCPKGKRIKAGSSFKRSFRINQAKTGVEKIVFSLSSEKRRVRWARPRDRPVRPRDSPRDCPVRPRDSPRPVTVQWSHVTPPCPSSEATWLPVTVQWGHVTPPWPSSAATWLAVYLPSVTWALRRHKSKDVSGRVGVIKKAETYVFHYTTCRKCLSSLMWKFKLLKASWDFLASRWVRFPIPKTNYACILFVFCFFF